MPLDDPSLQELIVRALAGYDQRARKTLDDVAASDPELKAFCSDLENVVSLLSGSKDWRKAAPSAELTAKIRAAVVSKLPAAPPHFRTAFLEADLGRRRAARRIFLYVVLFASLAAIALWYVQQPRTRGEWRLSGLTSFEASLKDDLPSALETLGDGQWSSSKDGLRNTGGDEPAALFVKNGFDGESALGYDIDVTVPALDETSTVSVFIADGAGAQRPSFGAGARPQRALSLEITRDGMVLNGADQKLLFSKPAANTHGFYRVRMEHLGERVRVLVNGEAFYDGAAARPLSGPLFPGIRISGPRKTEFRFNTLRVER